MERRCSASGHAGGSRAIAVIGSRASRGYLYGAVVSLVLLCWVEWEGCVCVVP